MKNILQSKQPPSSRYRYLSVASEQGVLKPALRQHFGQHLIKFQRFGCHLPHHIVFTGVYLSKQQIKDGLDFLNISVLSKKLEMLKGWLRFI